MPIGYLTYCLIKTYDKSFKEAYKSFIYIFNIIDALLCAFTIVLENPLTYDLFETDMKIYYLLGCLFAIFPVVTQFFYNGKLDKRVVKHIITRIFMVLIAGLIIYDMTSCSVGNIGKIST